MTQGEVTHGSKLRNTICKEWRTITKRVFFAGMLATTACSPVLAFERLDAFCARALPLELSTIQEIYKDADSDDDVFQLEVLAAGVLIVEVAGQGGAWGATGGVEPRVEIFSKDCAVLEVRHMRFVEYSPTRSIIKIDIAGSYFLRVNTVPRTEGGTYRIAVGFTRARPIRRLDSVYRFPVLKSPETDGVPFFVGAYGPESTTVPSKDEEIPETEEDDVNFFRVELPAAPGTAMATLIIDQPGVLEMDAGGAEILAFLEPVHFDRRVPSTAALDSGILTSIEAGEYNLRVKISDDSSGNDALRLGFFPSCGLTQADDHGDSPSCARVGSPVR